MKGAKYTRNIGSHRIQSQPWKWSRHTCPVQMGQPAWDRSSTPPRLHSTPYRLGCALTGRYWHRAFLRGMQLRLGMLADLTGHGARMPSLQDLV